MTYLCSSIFLELLKICAASNRPLRVSVWKTEAEKDSQKESESVKEKEEFGSAKRETSASGTDQIYRIRGRQREREKTEGLPVVQRPGHLNVKMLICNWCVSLLWQHSGSFLTCQSSVSGVELIWQEERQWRNKSLDEKIKEKLK